MKKILALMALMIIAVTAEAGKGCAFLHIPPGTNIAEYNAERHAKVREVKRLYKDMRSIYKAHGTRHCAWVDRNRKIKGIFAHYRALKSQRWYSMKTAFVSRTVSVRGYFRKDGTYVRPHTRKK